MAEQVIFCPACGQENLSETETEAERAVILAEVQRLINAINVEKNANAIDTLIQVLAADRELMRYRDSLEAYKVARGLVRR